ncbi:MAG: type I-C CRISPR-associated protein Cas8c/Csd1 [Clostridiales bacterium]|nr:type I-C CRISPR-associated protein Cas8c/Csd1 [Clostridiales bacterium]
MILQSLMSYYETLVESGKAAKPGWCHAKVSYVLNLSADGALRGIIPLKSEEVRGKKTVMVPAQLLVPEMVSRSSGVSANFLCDNSKYMLGIDAKGCGKRVQDCFEASKKKHLEILNQVPGDFAEAIRKFFELWNPKNAEKHPEIVPIWADLTAGGNIIFGMGMRYAQDDENIKAAWEKACSQVQEGETGICLVTGKQTEIARIHTGIKGVLGAQSSGAALISFNEQSFTSYGKEQSYNAPVGKYAMFAYTTALNYLLSQRDYVFTLGDTTVVFWAEDGDESYQEALCSCMEPEDDDQETIAGVFTAIRKQQAIQIKDVELNPNQKCYILGLSPNAARLSVRFFYQDSFGNILTNLEQHYKRMEIQRPAWDKREFLGFYRTLQATVNQKSKDKKPLPNLTAGMFQAVFSNGKYPESLYSNTLIRIRSDQGKEEPGGGKVTRARAAIIKAYLIKNKNELEKGETFVELNEETMDTAYVLGRTFALLEEIQEKANPNINATIRDRYFNAACTTPEFIFPVLMRLKNSHIRKLDTGRAKYYEKTLAELQGEISCYPKRLNLEEQGKFILGYYHQVQRRFTKKEEKKNG